jgi:hypothetical protein
MIIETIKLEPSRTNEKQEIIWKGMTNLRISYFWDFHGKLIPWEVDSQYERETDQAVHCKLIRETWTEFDENWENFRLEVQDHSRFNVGSVNSFEPSGKFLINVTAIAGWG